MLDVDLPEDEAVPAVTRSFAACAASVTETPIDEVPQPRADLSGAISHWRSWLASRGAGLVTLARPATFNWPGYWLPVIGQSGPSAEVHDGTAVLMFGTPSGVVLSPQDASLLGRAAIDLPVREGYVVCGLEDPALIAPTSPECAEERCAVFFERSLSALGALLGFGGPVVEVSRKALLRPGADDVVAPGVRLLGRGEEEVPFLFGEAVGVRQ